LIPRRNLQSECVWVHFAQTLHSARPNPPLGSAYSLERDLGGGGMATVYVAEGVRHHRRGLTKVVHPELGAVLGGERFLARSRSRPASAIRTDPPTSRLGRGRGAPLLRDAVRGGGELARAPEARVATPGGRGGAYRVRRPPVNEPPSNQRHARPQRLAAASRLRDYSFPLQFGDSVLAEAVCWHRTSASPESAPGAS
jgi:hypothetical protein